MGQHMANMFYLSLKNVYLQNGGEREGSFVLIFDLTNPIEDASGTWGYAD